MMIFVPFTPISKVREKIEVTPMIEQYLEIKKMHSDCILFFRLGDFYEMFFEDAKFASSVLKITLTSRGKTENQKIPMCGVPYHSAQGYIQKLLDAGQKIAICEQRGDPSQAKGIVEREVVRIITPSLRPHDLHSEEQRYLASVVIGEKESHDFFGLAYLDLSTGEFRATVLEDQQSFLDEFFRISPKELLWPQSMKDHKTLRFVTKIFPTLLVNFMAESETLDIVEGLSPVLQSASSALFGYLKRTHYEASSLHMQKLDLYEMRKTMQLDRMTIRNLELFETQYHHDTQGSLFWLLNKTKTAMGRRLLKQWMLYPLLNVYEIQARQERVRKLVERPSMREAIQRHLSSVLDLERIVSRLTLGLSNARDLMALKETFVLIPEMNSQLSELNHKLLLTFGPLVDLLGRALAEIPPLSVREGNMIREGYDPQLDELLSLCRDSKSFLANLERKERERTGIGSLKVRYNQVFGYYIEVTKVHLKSVPPDYIRKQTLVNSERYMTPELKEFEHKILSAEEKRKKLEYEIFEKLSARVLDEISGILNLAHECAELDLFCSLAELASENQYVCPEVSEDFDIDIIEGRHPVIEKILEERFVPNDLRLDGEKNLILIITGPNMSGKSTIMRQTALIILMAQMGSFVPAKKARMGIVDRIFTRVGAQDNLSQGESTFMVEMRESAHILKRATSKSFILLDEIGRGTSTFDGLSIAWGVASHIHDKIGAKTLFATHYHELTYLAEEKGHVQNFHVAVREINGEIVFIRKLLSGGMRRSYGIEVARLAGLPKEVIEEAKKVMQRLEEKRETAAVRMSNDSSFVFQAGKV